MDIERIMRRSDISELTLLMEELKTLLTSALTEDNEFMVDHYKQKIVELRIQLDNLDKTLA